MPGWSTAHGAPIGKLAHRLAGLLPDLAARKVIETAGIDRLSALHLAIELVRRGGIDDLMPLLSGEEDPLGVDHFATHRVPLEEAPHAYEIFQKKQDGAFKVLLKP